MLASWPWNWINLNEKVTETERVKENEKYMESIGYWSSRMNSSEKTTQVLRKKESRIKYNKTTVATSK